MTNGSEDIDYERIVELISKYKQIKKSGEIRRYNEEMTKKDFIQPLFEALGWNTANRGKRNDSMSAEETISKKRVDYGFRINGIPKFFLEAKSLREENIQTNTKYITQAIDYAWMKSCPWAVLTNFETIAVYNADWKESNYGNNLFFVLHPDDFLTEDRFVKLSKASFEKNELDEVASKYGKKQVRNPINKQLLQDMIHFREILSKNIVSNSQSIQITQEEVDESVQRILDRLIFIRNSEDRTLEENKLQSDVRQWASRGKGNLIKEISRIYREYDKIYNSKLFAHHLCDDTVIDDEVLQEVIEGLNESKDHTYRYDFSAIESDVLGNIYEQYLGNLLKTTPKRAKLSESRTHRKEQGIYYTPSYIVDYIIRNTVGEYIDNHTADEIRNVRILDPACGSGSFLIRAYQELGEYWARHEEKKSIGMQQTTFDSEYGGEFYSRKTDILRNNIFGVDLDPKAVEIAQLNLLLKVSEKKRQLPLLQNNLKVGNSIIDDAKLSERAFVWEDEFPEIVQNGGMDIIVGNPPYFKIFENDILNRSDDYKEIKSGMMNASAVFINKSLKLLKDGGYLGMIVPKMLAFTDSWDIIRRKLLENCRLIRVVDCGKAFRGVLLEQIIFILKKEPNTNADEIIIGELNENTIDETAHVPQKLCIEENLIALEPKSIAYEIKRKMEESRITLGDITEINLGLGIQGKPFFHEEEMEGDRKVLRGEDIQRYFIRGSKFYDPLDENIRQYRNTIDKFRTPHIVTQRIVAHIRDHIKITSALDEEGLLSFNTVTNIFVIDNKYPPEFVLAILNSNPVQYYTYKFIYSNAVRSMDFYKAYAKKIPLPRFDARIIRKVSELSRNLIDISRQYRKLNGRMTDDSERTAENIAKLENTINEEVYRLYGLERDQIEAVENSLS